MLTLILRTMREAGHLFENSDIEIAQKVYPATPPASRVAITISRPMKAEPTFPRKGKAAIRLPVTVHTSQLRNDFSAKYANPPRGRAIAYAANQQITTMRRKITPVSTPTMCGG